jgi:hypothetical protein
MVWQAWINDAVTALPGNDDALFEKIWNEQKLLFDGKQGIGDTVDYLSARLVAATIRCGERLLVTLPDFRSHRPAFLLATALLRHFLDSRKSISAVTSRSSTVLYFGTVVGIREQLRRTSIQGLGLALADVFSQQDISRGATGLSYGGSSVQSTMVSLPHVITVYAPADPVTILQAYRPCWIAIDCSDAQSLVWLQTLLKESTLRRIPVIAWGQNPLSECVSDFASYGHIFTWPPSTRTPGCSPPILNGEPDALLYSPSPICLSPFVLQGGSIHPFSTSLQDAGQLLNRATRYLDCGGCFKKDAVAVHWKYLRSLESLAVPFDFYEAEAPQFWGLQSFSKLASVCDYFRTACIQNDLSLYRDLEETSVLLNRAKTLLENQGCTLWEALTNLCIEDLASGEVRILIFSNDCKKRLFLFAMLARHNTTEDDLHRMRTYCMSSARMRQICLKIRRRFRLMLL